MDGYKEACYLLHQWECVGADYDVTDGLHQMIYIKKSIYSQQLRASKKDRTKPRSM